MTSKKAVSSKSKSKAVVQKKESNMEKFVENFDGLGRLVSVTVNPEAEEIFSIGTTGQEEMENGKSALRAAIDFYRFGKWNHKETAVGLHLKADANLRAFMATNLGVISAQYDGDLPIPRPESGWAQVNLRNGRFYLSRFNKEYAEFRERKHDFVDAYIMDMGIDIRVLPWNVGNGDNQGLATTLLNTWKELDDAKALKMKYDGYNRVNAARYAETEIVKAKKAGVRFEEVAGPVNGAIVLNTDNGQVQLSSLKQGRYKVTENGNFMFTVNWDGGIYAASRLKQIANKPAWELQSF